MGHSTIVVNKLPNKIIPLKQSDISTVTNEFMMQMLNKTKNYTVVILKKGPNDTIPERQQIIWEHGRRNFELRESEILSIVCPVIEQDIIRGMGIFNADKQAVEKIFAIPRFIIILHTTILPL